MPRRSLFFLVLALALAALPAAGIGSSAQASPSAAPVTERLFTRLTGFTLPSGGDWIRPERFTAYDVALGAVGERLGAAPSARAAQQGATPLRISLPDPSGRLVAFEVVEDSIMEPGLAAAYPEISTYAGRAVQDPTQTVRLDITPLGFHASVRRLGAGRAWYIDPAANGTGVRQHLSYYGASLPEPAFDFEERGLAELAEGAHSGPEADSAGVELERVPAGQTVKLRTYRLALATDPAYAAYFGGDDTSVLAAKVTLMNRVNQIYNDDFAIKMVLVEGTDTKLNFSTVAEASGANGPCGIDPCYDAADLSPETGGCSSALLSSNEFALGQVIGADNYDIGHIALGINGGGIAGLGVVGESRKAAGCTGLPFPTGDFFAVDYVAHEMGHQFAANHTFNGTQGNCSLTNRNGGTSVEPGSGSSVMAYAGICGQDDLQPHTDPYFSQRSIDEVDAHVTAAATDFSETQVITLRGFDTDGELVNLAYEGRVTTIERGTLTYNGPALQQKIADLTGEPDIIIGGYNGSEGTPNDGGFFVGWNDSEDHPRIQITGASQGVSGFTGVTYEGGPGTNGGVSVQPSANHAPAVVAPADKTIPFRTPFTLTGSGSDVDGDSLIYLWEQNDTGSALPNGGTALTSNTKDSGPLFRVFGKRADVSLEESLQYESPDQNLADGSPSRTFPDLDQILAGNTNAKTGSCPAPPADPEAQVPVNVVECYAEFLPTGSRTQPITMRLTARDGFPTAGGTQHDDTVLTVSTSAGPFLVTSQGDGAGVVGGAPGTVTWAVNGTNTAALAQNVRILLSTDGGRTYPTVLAATTPNDGTHEVTWPNVTAEKARVKVEAIGNYFFDLNDADFPIQAGLEVRPVEGQTAQHSDPLDEETTFTVSSGDTDGDQLAATISGVPGLVATKRSTSEDGVRPGTATYAVTGAVGAPPGLRTATITATLGERTATRTFPVTVRAENATVDYTGANTVEADQNPEPVAFRAEVGQADDGSLGDLSGAQVEFVDRGNGEVLCTADVTAEGEAMCLALLEFDTDPSTYVIGSRVVGAFTRDSAADDETVMLTGDGGPGDTKAPNTLVASGPRTGTIVADRDVTFRLDSNEQGTTYDCWLDGEPVPCTRRAALTGLGSGTHRFLAVATDPAGNTDTTPVSRRFAVAFDDRALRTITDRWSRRTPGTAYDGTLTQTRGDGQLLVRRVVGAKELALVVNRGPRMGKVAVYLDGERIRTLNLRADESEERVIMPIASFRKARTLRVRIETVADRLVQIDGLGVYGR